MAPRSYLPKPRRHHEDPQRLDFARSPRGGPYPADARPERIKAGHPSQTVWNHYSDPSQQFHVGFWNCAPGRWAIHYTEHEYCQLLEGDVVIHDSQGGQLALKPGNQFVIPAGFVGEWETLTPVARSM